MKEISNNEKLKQLKLAVLSNDFEAVEQVFAEYGDKILFATKALGLACRFCGVDMVKLLLDHGIRFNSKPGYIEWHGELLLFPEVDINKCNFVINDISETLLNQDTLSDPERADVIRLLLDRNAINSFIGVNKNCQQKLFNMYFYVTMFLENKNACSSKIAGHMINNIKKEGAHNYGEIYFLLS